MDVDEVIIDNAPAFRRATEAVQYLLKQLPETLQQPRLGIICGSGLGSLADMVLPQARHEIPYSAIPHFPSSSGTVAEKLSGTWRTNQAY